MTRRRLLSALAAALLGGCVLTGNSPPREYFVLEDLSAAAPRATSPAPLGLLVAPGTAASFYDTQSIVYSRVAGQRAYYQFANWTERPGRAFGDLLARRLERSGAFAQVAAPTAGVRGDLVLAVHLAEFYHDDARAPGVARLALVAELTDRRTRSLAGRVAIEKEAPVADENAAAAVAAFNRAVTAALDDLSAWTIATAAKSAAR